VATVSRIDKIIFMVSFAKEPYERDAILPKRPIILIDPTNQETPYYIWSSDSELHAHLHAHAYEHKQTTHVWYGVAKISRLLENIGPFCKRAL